ncbi:VWA domain-containing protein [Nocardioides marmoriginsengisoli]|uniref:VWA domain-containing protein n=1 Tax=Nocardioides marmoriginsengisoli TaxID=661483 RepID=A0A3N0CL97_9ACTN|nr:type II secretion system F family protein [Nocardioides marmoriginsengisoli]RNL64235.1 VWA domain-containing protein [Nocardioides marmoriginsengisoli]
MRTSWRLLAATGVAALGLLAPGTAHAAGDATIDHSELRGDTLRLLVSVRGDADVDLGSTKVTLGGDAVEATAELAASSDKVRRTTVLAIDTSNSMKGARIAEAKKAALTYLNAVPTNVRVGIVTFDDKVVVRQAPSLDRAQSKSVIDGLTLRLNTALYEGVQTAIDATGEAGGQRQVLVLSDGEDNTKADLQPVVDRIAGSGVKVDVVSLEQGADAPAPLAAMAEAGEGVVIAAADPKALTTAFTAEAGALARQVLVTATVPSSVTANDATVAVTLTAGGSTHTADAFVSVRDAGSPAAGTSKVSDVVNGSMAISQPLMYAAVLAIGVGMIGLIVALAGGSPREAKVPLSDQFDLYTATAPVGGPTRSQVLANQAASHTLAEQARQAASTVLSSNAGMEAKIARRLEGAGMALKSSEWLLMHLGITFLAGIVGLLGTGGNVLAMLLFVVLGAIGPWVYLGVKRAKRLKAFGAGLADTLQLMSGSLSAGLSLAQSMDTIVREGAEPITSEFKRAIVESRLGVGLEDALDGVADRMGSRDFKWVVMAIRIQREVGGNLAELLLTVAGTLREREYLRRHVQALSAEGRLSCWILGGLPPAFLVYLTLTKPEYVKPMYTTPIGWLMCAGMGILLGVGIVWMSKVAKVDV